MIIFYDKSTGQIKCTIEGRIHSEAQLKMWIGDRETTERVIFPWKVVTEGDSKYYEPEGEQKELVFEIDRREKKILDYKIDPKTKKLTPITS